MQKVFILEVENIGQMTTKPTLTANKNWRSPLSNTFYHIIRYPQLSSNSYQTIQRKCHLSKKGGKDKTSLGSMIAYLNSYGAKRFS